MKKKIKVMVVDDHTLFRQGIASLMKEFTQVSIIAEAKNGIEALKQLELCSPDVILLDLEMPLMNGHETSKRIIKEYPHIKVIILSMFNELYYIQESLKSGVHGYLTKGEDIKIVVSAIEVVHKGGKYLDDETSSILEMTTNIKKPIDCIIDEQALNEEEINLLKHICAGKSVKELSIELNLPFKTLHNRKNALKIKTGCANDADFVLYAFRHGIIK